MQLLEQWKALQLSSLQFDGRLAVVEGGGRLKLREAPPTDGLRSDVKLTLKEAPTGRGRELLRIVLLRPRGFVKDDRRRWISVVLILYELPDTG